MKAFIKENTTLALGLGLPLLLVFLLWGATEWTQRNTVPPQYDMLFATNYYDYSNGMRFTVENGTLKATHVGKGSSNRPKLYRFNAKDDTIKEIPYTIPPEMTTYNANGAANDTTTITTINIPDTQALKLDVSFVSPDGFTFENNYRGRPLFGELFFSGNSRYSGYSIALTKGGYRKYIPLKDSYSYSQKFIGWVVP